jgi:hypothetical protein
LSKNRSIALARRGIKGEQRRVSRRRRTSQSAANRDGKAAAPSIALSRRRGPVPTAIARGGASGGIGALWQSAVPGVGIGVREPGMRRVSRRWLWHERSAHPQPPTRSPAASVPSYHPPARSPCAPSPTSLAFTPRQSCRRARLRGGQK